MKYSVPVSVYLMLSLLFAGLAACRRDEHPELMRLGYMPNLTHAPALTGVASGRFAGELAPGVTLRASLFATGPSVIEALLAGELDAAFVGPGPAVVAHVRSRGRAVRVLSGVASGGALLVVKTGRGVRSAHDLRGRSVASPQIGNTQDIALRRYLHEAGLRTRDEGGDVRVLPLAPATILTQFQAGELDAAWLPEPWASRVVIEAGGEVLLDERTRWPRGRFSMTLLLARTRWIEAAPDAARALVRALEAEVARTAADPERAQREANAAIGAITRHPLPEPLLRAAWGHIEFTTDPLADTLAANARAAEELGFVPSSDVTTLVDARFLSAR